MSELSAVESRVLAAVDEVELGRRLQELIEVPSITGSAAESELQHHLAEVLEEEGLEVDLWPIDLNGLRALPGVPGEEAPRHEAWGLVGTLRGASAAEPPALILQGHVDVVPPGDRARWSGDQFRARVEGDLMYGRGACDMKAGLSAMLSAVRAIRKAGVELRRSLDLHLAAGEEDGGLGAFATLVRGHRGAACVIPEPTAETLITATAGALTFRLSVPGRATHGSTRYAGVSAVDVYLPVHAALAALEARRNQDADPLMLEYQIPYPISVGTLRAGDWPSSVPDALVAEGRLGVCLGEDVDAARRQLEEAVRAAAVADPWLSSHPVRVEWWGGQFESARITPEDPLAGLVSRAFRDICGHPTRRRGAPYGSDLRLYANAGIPTLHLGPGDVRFAHGPEERVSLKEVARTTRILALSALRSCGAG
ncbi:MAG: ArgE/DapE family deacylase [Candidatus Dormibacteria bacterium]